MLCQARRSEGFARIPLDESGQPHPWWDDTQRFYEARPRPPRDNTGIELKAGGTADTQFLHSLRKYDMRQRPQDALTRGAH